MDRVGSGVVEKIPPEENATQCDDEIDESLLESIARAPFDGKVTKGKVRGSGPRRDLIYQILKDARKSPNIDEYGNIWVELGAVGAPIVFSSHMDTEALSCADLGFKTQNFCAPDHAYKPWLDPDRTQYVGWMDNAAGCYLNLKLALSHDSDMSSIFIFTASEEENPKDRKEWARSAWEVIGIMKYEGIKPEYCVAIDVTWPQLLVNKMDLDLFLGTMPMDRLFNMHDERCCYVDCQRKAVRGPQKDAVDFALYDGTLCCAPRTLWGLDEASVYAKIAPSFAFGPVVFGAFDKPDQVLPKSNLIAASRFLRYLDFSG